MRLNIEQQKQHLKDLKKRIAKGDWTAPDHLTEPSQALWTELVPLRCRSAERLEALTTALEARDRLRQIHSELTGEQLTLRTGRFGVERIHPLLKHEQEARKQFIKLWRDLGLTWRGSMDSPTFDEMENPERVTGAIHYRA